MKTIKKPVFYVSLIPIIWSILLIPAVSYESNRPDVEIQGSSGRSKMTSAFNDSLSLGQCMELALANNPGISAKNLEIDAVESQKNEASSQRLPTLKTVSIFLTDVMAVGRQRIWE